MRLKKERDDERYTGEPDSPQEPGQPNRTSEENTPEKGDQIEKKRGNPIKRAYYYCVNRIYRYLYFVGIQLLRSTRTRRRHLSVRLSGLGRWFQARFLRLRKETRIHLRNLRHELTSPIRDLKEKRRRFRVELENARKFSGEAGVYRSYLRMAGLLLTGFWRAAGFVLSYLAPLTALIALVLLLQFFSGLTLALNLVYDGRDLGYIADESVFTQAENEMKARIVNEQYIKPEDIIPRFQITILKKGGSFLNPDDYITEDDLLEVDELTNLLIRASGNELEEAVGLYVENRFVSAVMDGDALLDYLDSMREQYRTNDMSRDAEISFMKKIQVKKGLYPVSSVKPFEQLAEILSSEEEGEKRYTVIAGDTPIMIAAKNGITFRELKRLNPEVDIKLFPGDSLLISNSVPYLGVKVIQTEIYEEEVGYKIEQRTNPNQNIGWTRTVQAGEAGKARVVEQVTLVDGVETGRKEIDRTVLQPAVPQIIEVGGNQPLAFIPQASDKPTPAGTWGWPTVVARIGTGYGGYYGHTGSDLTWSGCYGSPVLASQAGTVVVVRQRYYGYGFHVRIDHGGGVQTLYAHMSRIDVVPGQQVQKGQQIGLIGSTGNSSGPHLHFEILIGGTPVNAAPYLYGQK